MSIKQFTYALVILVGMPSAATSGDLDRYRFVLIEGHNNKVCRHMEKVYNQRFAYPWKRPSLTGPIGESAYGHNSIYAFPKLAGVIHDERITLDMSYSRFPTSAEFDAIQWREGRYRHVTAGQDRGERPILVAEFDIDNDGRIDIVIKGTFMLTYIPAGKRAIGGEDKLFVFDKGDIELNEGIAFDTLFVGRADRRSPRMIGEWSGAPYRIIRPFIFEGATYLSGYQPEWIDDYSIKREYMEITKYRGGGENLDSDKVGSDKWSPLQLDVVCKYRMQVIPRR